MKYLRISLLVFFLIGTVHAEKKRAFLEIPVLTVSLSQVFCTIGIIQGVHLIWVMIWPVTGSLYIFTGKII